MEEMLGKNAISPAVQIRGRVCISILICRITYPFWPKVLTQRPPKFRPAVLT